MTTIECLNAHVGNRFAYYQGDCVPILKQFPACSIGFNIHSPPFANLYTYSASERDMGNSVDDVQFMAHYAFAVREFYRTMQPGRLVAVHCKDLVDYAGRDGKAGLRDFPGEIIRLFKRCQIEDCDAHADDRDRGRCGHGFAWHAKTVIWKDPVVEMQRTKAHGLLYKQLRADSTFSRMGLPEYVLFFRKWATGAQEEAPLPPGAMQTNGIVLAPCEAVRPVSHTKDSFPLDQWQRWASPVWMDIRQTHVLNVQAAREDQDEKHMCPLQLDVIERCLVLYSRPDDVVLSPFGGIGSEGVVSLKMDRRFVGVELKESYWHLGCRNLREAEGGKGQQRDLFSALG